MGNNVVHAILILADPVSPVHLMRGRGPGIDLRAISGDFSVQGLAPADSAFKIQNGSHETEAADVLFVF